MENYIIPSVSQILIFLILLFALIISTYTRRYIEDDIEKYYKKMQIISLIILVSLVYFNYYVIIFVFSYLLTYYKKYHRYLVIIFQISTILFLSLLNIINSYYEFSLLLLFTIVSSFSYKK